MNYPLDVVLSKEGLEILNNISKVLGFRMSFFDVNYEEKAPLDTQASCQYCKLIQSNLGLYQECVKNDQFYCSQAKASGETIHYQCHAGLHEAVFPIIFDEECVGFFLVGQFRTEEELPLKITSHNMSFLKTQLEKEYNKLPHYNGEKLESALQLIRMTTSYILDNNMLALKQNQLGDELLAYIKNNYLYNVEMSDLVDKFHKSPSTINLALKNKTGHSFKQLIVQLRIKEASKLLRDFTDMTISEVAEKTGFSDPLYFSRLFKKHFKQSPREYRNDQI
ncbi:PocR ligand-binding domain-containing protein [Spirochaeta cellobiosiphila]|uniref:PocR ligand-binding domain-containing protein n=1 Tax=Spirochaeta cellobiosiphila TaxID=504483 RepID=UPI001B7FC590|nr:PocR ligand-binding domain-containing protein [Spirochaeta cellobiosiphila]